MDTSLARPLSLAEGLAYDRALGNRRAAFSLTQSLAADGRGWRSVRTWTGIRGEVLATENLFWDQGLRSVTCDLPTIGESTEAEVGASSGGAFEVTTRLRSRRTQGQTRTATLSLPHPPVTLASLPLFVAAHWPRLLAGDTLPASYLVLKVQRAATVTMRLEAAPEGGSVVRVTPRNLILRAIFGSTCLFLDPHRPVLRRLEGLLDPRDLKPGGRWIEYLGRIEFDKPWDLTPLAPLTQGVQSTGRAGGRA